MPGQQTTDAVPIKKSSKAGRTKDEDPLKKALNNVKNKVIGKCKETHKFNAIKLFKQFHTDQKACENVVEFLAKGNPESSITKRA